MHKINPYTKVADPETSAKSLEKYANNYPKKSLIHKTYMRKAIEIREFMENHKN